MATLPQDLVPSNVEIIEDRPIGFVQTRSGQVQRQSKGIHVWRFEIQWPPMTNRNYRRLMGFVGEMEGGVEPFELVVPGMEPLGSVSGKPVVREAHSKGTRSLKTRGWYSNSRVLKKGDLCRVGQKVYRVTAGVKANASGNATLELSPGLYKDVSDGEGIVVRGITFRVHFDSVSLSTAPIPIGRGRYVYAVRASAREDFF